MARALVPRGGARGLTFFVVGWPIGHSLSPALHRAAFEAAGSPHRYEALAVAPEDFPQFCERLRAEPGWGGANVTIPHKEAALAHADSADVAAREIGAANVLLSERGRLRAANTDGPALLACLCERAPTGGAKGVVLGAGGAARAAVWALARLGLAEVDLFARRPEAVRRLLDEVPRARSGGRWAAFALEDRAALAASLARAAIVVNATPVGLADPAQSPVPKDAWPPRPAGARGLVVDLVYGPGRRRLAAEAEGHGFTYVDGLPMLVRQAALSWSVWFGRPADEAVMWEAARARLAARP